MENVWLNISSFLLVFALAVVVPGPNFVLVAGASVAGSKRNALQTALGVAVGSGIFAISGLVGLLVLVRTLPYFEILMPLVGGGYLIYLGVRMVACPAAGTLIHQEDSFCVKSGLAAFRNGLLSNLTNPKAWAFYLSMFTVILAPGCPLWGKFLLTGLVFLISYAWYSSVVIMMTHQQLRPLIDRTLPLIQGGLGVLLVVMGGRLLLSSWFGS